MLHIDNLKESAIYFLFQFKFPLNRFAFLLEMYFGRNASKYSFSKKDHSLYKKFLQNRKISLL